MQEILREKAARCPEFRVKLQAQNVDVVFVEAVPDLV